MLVPISFILVSFVCLYSLDQYFKLVFIVVQNVNFISINENVLVNHNHPGRYETVLLILIKLKVF